MSGLYGAYRWDAECYQPHVLRDADALTHFPTVKLGDVSFITDGQHGYHEVDEESPIRHITARCVEGGIVTDAKADRLSLKTHNANVRSQLKAGDVLLSTAGTIGEAGIVEDDILPANIDQDVARIALYDDAPIDPYFLVAFLRSELGRFQSARATTGQIQGHIPLTALRDFEIPILKDQSKVISLMRRGVEARRSVLQLLADASETLAEAIGVNRPPSSKVLFYTRPFGETRMAARLDAEYFAPHFQNILKVLSKDGRAIGDIAALSQRRFRPETSNDKETFHYIEISSVRGDGLADSETVNIGNAPSRAQWIVQPGDVITSTVRPIRRLSAIITAAQSGYVCSSGFAVLRPKPGGDGIEPEVLLTFLRLPIISEILDLHTTASMYPAISTKRLMEIPIALPPQAIRNAVISKVRAAFKARTEAESLLEEAKTEVERMVLNSRR